MNYYHNMTENERTLYRYGEWAGNPSGTKYNPDKCAESIFPRDRLIPRQCSRKPGYGPRLLYCKAHAKSYEKADEKE